MSEKSKAKQAAVRQYGHRARYDGQYGKAARVASAGPGETEAGIDSATAGTGATRTAESNTKERVKP